MPETGSLQRPTKLRSRSRSVSALLHDKIELVSQPLLDASRQFLTHPRIEALYPEYLIALHCVVRSSVPVMRTALDRAEGMADSDPVADGLIAYLEGHIEEERGHDQWLVEDLERLGVSRAALLERVPSPAVAALVGSQYYWILHYHPVALLGYLTVAEGYPVAPSLIEDLIARTGYPRDAFRMLAEHAELDPHHRDELDELLDSLAITENLETLLGLSAISTVGFMARCIEEVVDGAATAPTPAPTND
ncbi:MAG: iron-containing redox enzyme family protein [Actinobacteria bacterium]|nr:MAG: iron-containing redox enzyme family protein [Actinomycetota bacterium]